MNAITQQVTFLSAFVACFLAAFLLYMITVLCSRCPTHELGG